MNIKQVIAKNQKPEEEKNMCFDLCNKALADYTFQV
jgi:hypothetical protein